MNVFGGEDRFWLGPEGGQYALYFAKGEPFDFDHWQVPKPSTAGPGRRRSGPAQVAFREGHEARQLFRHHVRRARRSDRRSLATGADTAARRAPPRRSSAVAYESENHLVNTGQTAWTKETGLLSVWILGMYQPSPRRVVVPFRQGPRPSSGRWSTTTTSARCPPIGCRAGPPALLPRRRRARARSARARARDRSGSYDAATGC